MNCKENKRECKKEKNKKKKYEKKLLGDFKRGFQLDLERRVYVYKLVDVCDNVCVCRVMERKREQRKEIKYKKKKKERIDDCMGIFVEKLLFKYLYQAFILNFVISMMYKYLLFILSR